MGGPHIHTSAPSFVSSSTFDRSTRLCSRSPTMATFRPADPPLALADGERVEQRLRRVLVHAVAGVDDARRGRSARESGRRPTQEWRMTSMSGAIASRFSAVSTSVSPLTTRGRARGDVERVRGQPLLGDLERRARARAGLEEEVDDRLAAQRRHLLDRPGADLLHRLGGVEDQHDLLGRQLGDAEQVLAAQPCRGRRRLHACCMPPHASFSMTTSSRPSISTRRTARSRASDVGRFFPT